jgi:hypothetical protein
MIVAFILGLLAAVALIAVVVLTYLSVKWVTKKVKERLAANKRHKVVFADMREVVDTDTVKQMEKQGEISMDDLERMCSEKPYVMADYDIDTGEFSDFTGIKADKVENTVKDKMKKSRGGIIAFDS